MEGGNDSLHRPCIEASASASSTVVTAAQGQTFDHGAVRTDTVETDRCVLNQAMDVSELVGMPVTVALEANPGSAVAGGLIGSSREKRKRGRPPRGQMVAAASASVVKPPPPKRRKEEEEEDVCFICFDGGSLVLCDRKGCPKAYHPACIKRDEAFFRSKAKWNCGWHICSVCQKAAHYMCYTCTYSLCKGCTKGADYVCVRGTMGFCTTCMKTIMLIENKEQANKEMVQVDFDDQTSWEYLFKVYWVILKEKLSLTLEELTQAENPCKGVASVARKQQLPNPHHVVNHGNGVIANSSHEHLELKKPKEPEVSLSKDCLSSEHTSNEKTLEKESNENGVSFVGPTEWASKELLEFVAHMKNGDASFLSQFDVQALLLEYIKKNNLRDPRRKSQIICDLRLKNLFGKPRVGHIEMLKLLEFHFLIKEDSQKDAFIPAGIVGTLANHIGSEDNNNENSQLTSKNNRRKSRRRVEERAPQNNLDEYAAIDVHNINLIYLRRSLMEKLAEDEKFQDKVVGSIVRIRISANDQKQDLYRLVQVVGTSKVAIPYKIGDKTVDTMLEVLNLDKKEAVAIDTISNQEFSEDECRRLRQSIRCGLVRRLTVGVIQKKALELLSVRLNDRLEAEILKLNHLRDRASETGRKKELRECVEKLQILKTPEELQRRLSEIPEVHADPKMNPSYDSEENSGGLDAKKQDEYTRQKYSEFSRSGSTSISPKRKVKEEGLVKSQCTSNPKRDPTCTGDQAVVRSGLGISVEALESGSSFSSNSSETDKLWHYRDPTGKVQGPFSMLQLRKWSMTGYFPPDMRIWINNEQNDSVLLTDALSGHFHTAADLLFSLSLPRQEVAAASDNRINNSNFRGNDKGSSQSSSTRIQFKDLDPLQDDNSCSGHLEVHHQQPQPNVRPTDKEVHHQLSQSDVRPADSEVHQQQPQSDVRLTDTEVHHQKPRSDTDPEVHYQQPQSDARPTDLEVHHQQPLSDARPTDLEVHHQQPLSDIVVTNVDHHPGEVHGSEGSKPDPCHEDQVHHQQPQSDQVPQASTFQITDQNSHENRTSTIQKAEEKSHDNQDRGKSDLGQSSQQNWRTFPINLNLNEMATTSGFSPATKSDSSEHNGDIDLHEFPSPTPKASDSKSEDQVAEKLQPMSSNVPAGTSHIPDIPVTSKPNDENQGVQIAESKEPLPSKMFSQDSGSSWTNASTIVVGGARLPEIHVDWGGYSPAPPKPPVEEWSSGLVSIPSLKQPEAVGSHATPPTSSIDPLAPTPSHPTCNLSGWHGVVEPIEFSTLAEESVSDLLAEVDAMESQSGLPSPTSAMRCGDEMMKGCKDYFSSIDDLSPTHHPGKSNALSSTVDIQLACQSSVTDEPLRASDPYDLTKRSSGPCQSSVTDEPVRASDPYDPTKRSSGHSSTSSEGETKSADVPVYHKEAGSAVHPTPSRNVSRGITSTTMPPNTAMETLDTNWGRVPGQVNLDWGLSAQGSMNIGWPPSQGMPYPAAPNLNRSPFGGGVPWDGQRRYSGERYPNTRDWQPQGGDVGHGRGRPFWSRQSSGGGGVGGGGGGGGGYSRPPPKGQRICKFYENGHCKKGASCSFLHP